MDWNDDSVEQEKTKFSTKMGCLFIPVALGISVISIAAWYILSSQETQLKISHSPNQLNSIEIVKKHDFPDPTIRIYYDDKNVMKTQIPDKTTVEWKNDYQAIVTLTKQGQEPDIVDIEFDANPDTER
ncbi:hypothetical protein [Jeotgalibacillus campisalis]|uniref:Uncharacterized protein n=1 Tax=Jeotgalibacillus campisalis TaxID=220754 RepID=A0A0C2SGU1_9BACL|nr:hypothetical protein [Jeotgalibacillus campisalis]KIL53154.1 hypothetical protein KR50_04830 [Jeotgalibacillus campisalis]